MKRKIIYALLITMLVLNLIACGNKENELSDSSSSTEVVQTEEVTENEKIENTSYGGEFGFVEDSVVNRFITEYNDLSSSPISEISEGNIDTKYFGVSYNCYLEMINANDAAAAAFSLTINGGQDEKTVEEIFNVFRVALKVFKPEMTDDEIEVAVNDLKNNQFTDDTLDCSYFSIKELSYGKTECRIDIYAYDYK